MPTVSQYRNLDSGIPDAKTATRMVETAQGERLSKAARGVAGGLTRDFRSQLTRKGEANPVRREDGRMRLDYKFEAGPSVAIGVVNALKSEHGMEPTPTQVDQEIQAGWHDFVDHLREDPLVHVDDKTRFDQRPWVFNADISWKIVR